MFTCNLYTTSYLYIMLNVLKLFYLEKNVIPIGEDDVKLNYRNIVESM